MMLRQMKGNIRFKRQLYREGVLVVFKARSHNRVGWILFNIGLDRRLEGQ